MLAATFLCLVVGISDGDTLTARCGEPGAYEQVKVRLQGIDAPERKQPFGERARKALADLAFQKEAELRCNKIDRYKRHVCSVWVKPDESPGPNKTLDVGLVMVAQGMAGGTVPMPANNLPRSAGSMSLPSRKPRPVASACGKTRSPSRHGTGASSHGSSGKHADIEAQLLCACGISFEFFQALLGLFITMCAQGFTVCFFNKLFCHRIVRPNNFRSSISNSRWS